PRRALPRQTQHPENRAQASDLTDAHETLGPQDHLLFKNDPDARRRPWLVCQSLCLWTGSVNMVISTFETLPAIDGAPLNSNLLGLGGPAGRRLARGRCSRQPCPGQTFATPGLRRSLHIGHARYRPCTAAGAIGGAPGFPRLLPFLTGAKLAPPHAVR